MAAAHVAKKRSDLQTSKTSQRQGQARVSQEQILSGKHQMKFLLPEDTKYFQVGKHNGYQVTS